MSSLEAQPAAPRPAAAVGPSRTGAPGRALRLVRSLRRVEVRAALGAGLAVALLLALQAAVFYAFVADEYVEEAHRQLATQARLVAAGLAHGASGDAFAGAVGAEGIAIRIEPGPAGAAPSRPAPDPSVAIEERVALPSGATVVATTLLAHTRQELREVRAGLLAILLLSFAGGVALVFFAVQRSFALLRESTRRIEAAGADGLSLRLPVRGTDDLVDRHATALNGALARIADAFARLRAFSGDAAHELRTPVHRIRNVAELALIENEGAEATRDALRSILESSDELARTLDALLLLARLEEDGQPLAREPLALPEWLAHLLDLYRPLCAERGITLHERVEPAWLAGDRALLDRLVCNLVENAIRHGAARRDGGAPRGRIEVTGGPARGGVELRVGDAGPGIPAPAREWIFDRFRRLDPARGGPGSGIGLALARAIARAHGGTLRVEDDPLGGARFVVWLPSPAPVTSGAS